MHTCVQSTLTLTLALTLTLTRCVSMRTCVQSTSRPYATQPATLMRQALQPYVPEPATLMRQRLQPYVSRYELAVAALAASSYASDGFTLVAEEVRA